ncbi:MAG: hypothetical protein H7315_00630 [Herminiimonas sp.]|nr:hypothetical protein [Herminiimonas sp.]
MSFKGRAVEHTIAALKAQRYPIVLMSTQRAENAPCMFDEPDDTWHYQGQIIPVSAPDAPPPTLLAFI